MNAIAPATTPIIQVSDLSKSFAGKRVVDRITFDVMPGDTFAFLGPNGAGKSTTIKMLTTLLPPDGGRVLIDGMDVARHPMQARSRFGIVFQDCTLDTEMTVQENLWMHCVFYHVPRSRRRACIDAAIALFDLGDRRHDLVGKLSGGLKRRVEIARALLHAPPVIFLDEPTLGLDPQSRHQLWDHLRILRASTNVTVFLTTHYLEEVERFASHVAIIDQGRIVAHGTVDAIAQQTQRATLEDSFLFLTRQARQSAGPLRQMVASGAE